MNTYNLITLLLTGWVGLAVITGLRIGKIDVWPGDVLDSFDGMNPISPEVNKVLSPQGTLVVTAANATEPMR